jgi:hypothetical protein
MSGGSIGASVSRAGPPKSITGPDDAIQRLLEAALDDSERRFSLDLTTSKIALHDPRICDFAALALSQRWPKKYPYEWTANSVELDARLEQLRNHIRADKGLPPATPAPRVTIPPAREADVASLLDEFAAAKPEQRDALTEKIDTTFGLGALPIVRARLEASKDPALRALAVHLASRVREVRILADASGSAGKSKIALLKDQSLTSARLYQLASDLEDFLPADVRAVTLVAERAGDGAGFLVTLQWLPGQPRKYEGWTRELTVHGGGQGLGNDGGWTRHGAMARPNIYERFCQAFEIAVQSDIDAPITVRLRLQRDNATPSP